MKYPKKLHETNTHGRFSSYLIRGKGESTPVEPPPPIPEPEIACHSTTDHVEFSFEQIDEEGYGVGGWSEDQRYAIKVGNSVFNSDHSLSILGQQFELEGRVFSIPYSSGSSAYIYVDEYTDDVPVRVKFIPGPDSQYNTIYSVNQGYEIMDSEVEYIDKDTEFSICLRPEITERVFTCVGATDALTLKFAPDTLYPTQLYITINDAWSFSYYLEPDGDNLNQFSYRYDYDTGEDISESITATFIGDELTFNIVSNGPEKNYRLKIYNLSNDVLNGLISISEKDNPTAYYSNSDESIRACITSTVPVFSCVGATDVLRYSLQQPMDGYNLNHTTLVYNISIDGVDYGEHDLTEGRINLDHITLENYVDSGGSGTLYTSTQTGNEPPARFVFTPREDMVDANFWGVDEDSNPTVVYNAENRSINVCLAFSVSANAV